MTFDLNECYVAVRMVFLPLAFFRSSHYQVARMFEEGQPRTAATGNTTSARGGFPRNRERASAKHTTQSQGIGVQKDDDGDRMPSNAEIPSRSEMGRHNLK